MTKAQMEALAQIGRAIVDTVRQSGAQGAPGGHLYAALMASGCTLSQFEQIMGALVEAGLLRKRGQCYFAQVAS